MKINKQINTAFENSREQQEFSRIDKTSENKRVNTASDSSREQHGPLESNYSEKTVETDQV